ncbi:MAG: glyoxalase [Thermoleophilia bacterium]|nr:glyoxalase [Thermoleophilia bacterium]
MADDEHPSRPVIGVDHFQVCCPRGGEGAARAFYGDLLGLPEVPKPGVLASRGGCWFRAGATGLHVGVLEPFVPSTKGHPALRVRDLETLEALAARLGEAGHPVDWSDEPVADARCKLRDPFGNLVELLVGTTG